MPSSTPMALQASGRLALPADALRDVATDIRRDILATVAHAGSGHTGGSLSACDLLTAVLFHSANLNPADPAWVQRDFWNVSNAHISPLIYAAMARRGYFSRRELLGFRQIDGRLQGHPSAKDVPGIEVAAGSIGQGLSVACGAAMAAKLDKHPRRIFCLMGDGEQQEGQIWEAAMSAAHYRLDNLTALIDYNQLQIDGPVEEVTGIAPLADKYRAFNWRVIEVDGHDMAAVLGALTEAERRQGRPTVILAHTVMGKGWPAIEGDYRWHGKPPTVEQADEALRGLGTTYADWLDTMR